VEAAQDCHYHHSIGDAKLQNIAACTESDSCDGKEYQPRSSAMIVKRIAIGIIKKLCVFQIPLFVRMRFSSGHV